jgi:signal transduction histidine kinase
MIASMTSTRQRIGKFDVAIAVVFSLLGLLLMYGNVQDNDVDASVLAMPLFLLVTVPLLWRRAAPVAATGATLAGLVVHDLLFGTDVVRCGVVLPVAFLLVFSSGARLEQRDAVIGLALGLGLIVAESITFFGPFGVFFAALTAATWGIGRIARSRARMAEELKERTAELREARDERARLEVATDRARLSSELEELLQRRLGQLARMADEGGYSADSSDATATLVDIERESRRTLDEMRGLVGVLRNDSELAATPQPTLTALEALLVRAKGANAHLRVEGSPRILPPGVELSAYRVVEHLLAAVDGDSEVEVNVRFGDDALELTVSGSSRRGAKASIERARERVQLHRGTLEATTRGGRAEAVAWLPVAARA